MNTGHLNYHEYEYRKDPLIMSMNSKRQANIQLNSYEYGPYSSPTQWVSPTWEQERVESTEFAVARRAQRAPVVFSARGIEH